MLFKWQIKKKTRVPFLPFNQIWTKVDRTSKSSQFDRVLISFIVVSHRHSTMSTLSKAELEKANGQIAHLKSLIKVHKCDNQYAVERHGMDKQKFIHNSRYRHLKRADLEKKLEKWVLKKAQHRKNRIQITFYNKEEEEEEDSNPSKYSMDQVQQLILYCFAANREEITFATISNLRQVERVCVYVLEDQKLDQHFKNDFKSRFDHVLNYECPDNWFYSLHQISIKKRQVIVKGVHVCVLIRSERTNF